MRRFRAEREGVVVDLPDGEQQLLRSTVSQLRELLMADADPALRRLKPPAHPDDPEAEQAYRELVDDDMLLARLEAIESVEKGIGGALLDADGVAAWMHTLNALRLVLGERLADHGVDLVVFDPHDLDDEHELAPAAHLYDWMGFLLTHLVDAADGTLPDT